MFKLRLLKFISMLFVCCFKVVMIIRFRIWERLWDVFINLLSRYWMCSCFLSIIEWVVIFDFIIMGGKYKGD